MIQGKIKEKDINDLIDSMYDNIENYKGELNCFDSDTDSEDAEYNHYVFSILDTLEDIERLNEYKRNFLYMLETMGEDVADLYFKEVWYNKYN